MTYEILMRSLRDDSVIILDGANGTELELRGIPMDDEAWCGLAAIDNIQTLKEIHMDYIKSGADIITTNTYASNRMMLEAAGLAENFRLINESTVRVAISAAREFPDRNILVAGSLSHRTPVDDNGNLSVKLYEQEAYTEMALLLEREGCDLILLEMLYHPDRVRHVLNAAKNTQLPLWVGFSARKGRDGKLLSYYPGAAIPFEELVSVLSEFEVQAAGIMHTPSNLIDEAISIIKQVYNGPLTAYPDSGHFKSPNWQFENIIPTAELVDYAKLWVKNGVKVLGGCCGLSPGHIKVLSSLKK